MLTKDEFEKRFTANYLLIGFGLAMEIHSPCPFCAAPDFHVYRLEQLLAVTGKETVCKECGRGLRVDWENNASTTTALVAQTQGDDPPDYIPIARAKAEGELVRIEKQEVGDVGDVLDDFGGTQSVSDD